MSFELVIIVYTVHPQITGTLKIRIIRFHFEERETNFGSIRLLALDHPDASSLVTFP